MNSDHGSQPSERLWSRGYLALLVCQFMGAANDNILKQCLMFMVATGVWSGMLGDGGQVVPALCLTLPFIFLSGYGGQVADRFSKQRVILWVKIAEIPIALTALIGFWTENLWLALAALLLLSAQSSFFGPAKYGIIPELVADRHLSQANGFINMFTNLAVILGSLAAGPICDLYYPQSDAAPNGVASTETAAQATSAEQTQPIAAADSVAEAGAALSLPEPMLTAPGLAMVLVAILGLVAAWGLPKLKAADPEMQWCLNPFATYVSALREMAKSPLLTVALAWSGFYMIGWMALLIVPEYEDILAINYTKTSYLVGTLGIAIAVGSVASGLLSGDRIRPWFIPFGAIGMTACFLLLGTLTPAYSSVAGLIFGTGVFAGFYIVPLQSLMQHLSPDDERGRFLGTANALSFCFTTAGSLVYWVARKPLQMPANRVHLICGALALMGTIVGIVRLRRITDA